jgi:hypothetical protein
MFDLFRRLRAASTRFADEFWRGFEEARAQSEARAQPVPLAGHPLAGLNETEIKATIAAALRGSFDEGARSERSRIEAILTAPGAKTFPEIAVDLVLGPASSAQAVAVLARADADAATRAGIIKSNLLESANAPTLH